FAFLSTGPASSYIDTLSLHDALPISHRVLAALTSGLGMGLAAGVSPGPLLVLVVTSTLRGGLRNGIAVAAAPLLSDLVVVTAVLDRKSTRLNSSHVKISYAVFCLKKK